MEDLERQLDELTAIQSLYEGDVTVETPDTHITHLQSVVENSESIPVPRELIRFVVTRRTETDAIEFSLTVVFPENYPSGSSPDVAFRCDAISRSDGDIIKANIATQLSECEDNEAIMSVVEDTTQHMNTLAEHLATQKAQQDELALTKAHQATSEVLYKRCTFLCDHMLSGRQHKKESKVKEGIEGLGLTGVLFYGKPSVVIVEGTEEEIEAFVRDAGKQGKTMKKRKTQSLHEGTASRMYQKLVVVNAMGKTESLDTDTLKEHLETLGIGAKFKHIIGVEELQ